ncbi:helix-turn-helix transcriptional regulator [Streptomyces sp. NPDC045369]|uniref:helix-turn-helix domain-containing protein n=1 Tax=Streptomyces sp. NPDC045369 TaxID=3155732 RepID=UPI0033CAD2B1
MHATGETQKDLAHGLRITQGQVSRKLTGRSLWALDDLDRLATHYGVPVPDLLCGPSHALTRLPRTRLAPVVGGTQTTIPA